MRLTLPTRRRLFGLLTALVTLTVTLGVASNAFTQESATSGVRIVDLVARLRAQGISVIYSSDLLPDTLILPSEINGRIDLQTLEIALEPFGLALRAGPRNSWLVVAAPPSAEDNEIAEFVPDDIVFRPPPLENVIVSASRYTFTRSTGTSTTRIDRTQLINAPTLGSDALRATHALPGLTSTGLTARVNVRGGDSDEALYLLEGVRLFNPFHLKDFQSLFSSLDPRIVDSMAIYTGAYPAQYGDRMSAVIDMQTINPDQYRDYEIGISTLTSSVLASGQFAGERGTWLTSIRRGNLDLLIDAARANVGAPKYNDLYSKLTYSINSQLNVSGGLLILNDRISLQDSNTSTSLADYRDGYAWLALLYTAGRSEFGIRYSAASLSTRREGEISDTTISTGMLRDNRDFDNQTLNATWALEVNDKHWLQTGVEFSDSDARYDFESELIDRISIATPGLAQPPTAINEFVELNGMNHAVFLNFRSQLGRRITTELGLRWDDQDIPSDTQFSPRLNVLYDINDRLSFRASWGRFFQSQGLYELQIGDGETDLFPAQEAVHTVFGLEYLAGENISIRLEAYKKEFERLRPRFENLYGRVTLLPELQPDRIKLEPNRGVTSGAELSIDGARDPWRWWLNITRSRTRDYSSDFQSDRSWEEPWSYKGGFTWSRPKWTVSLTATIHTGWPITNLSLNNGELIAGGFNQERLNNYRSLDARASRTVNLDHGEFEWFVELNNALNQDNACCLDYQVQRNDQGEPISLDTQMDNLFGIVPTIGFFWRTSRANE